MKKIINFVLIFIIAISCFSFGGCTKENTIKISEVTHSIFYAPLYVAINNGYFKEQGYEIELTNGGGSDASMTALLSGACDIALVGPETVVYVANQGKQDAPKVFGQLTKRDGSFLVGRTNETNFNWSNLNNKHIIAGRRGGSPAMSLQYALEKNGYDISTDLNFDLSIAFNMTTAAFVGGTGDYVTVFEPTASEMVKNGQGYIVAAVGEESGEIPFTCFTALDSYISKNENIINMFLKCILKAYNFIVNSDINDVVASLKPSFETTSDESIKASINSYISIDAWCSTPVMSETAYNRLLQMLTNAGELSNNVDMIKVVNNTYARQVMLNLN